MMRRATYTLGCIIAIVLAAPARAQGFATLTVTVRDSVDGLPLRSARIDIAHVSPAATDALGVARLQVPAGTYVVSVRAVAHLPQSFTVELAEGSSIARTIVMTRIVQTFDTTDVTAVRSAPLPADFERRRASATRGFFLATEQIDSLRNQSLSMVMRGRASGAKVVAGGGSAGAGEYLASTRPRDVGGSLMGCGSGSRGGCASSDSARTCYATVYVDGLKVFAMSSSSRDPGQPPFDLRSEPLTQIAAIEYYPNSAVTPAELRDGNSLCGTLMIWHRTR